MTVNLTSYTSIRAATFVRLQVDQYRTNSTGGYFAQTLRFSDHNANFDIDGETYTALGRLLGVTSTASELRSSSNDITVTLSGIPNSSIAEVIHSKIKGSAIQIYRAYFTVAGVQIGATQTRWKGTVSNFALDEEYNVLDMEATNSIQLSCISSVDLLQKKQNARRTNPVSMKSFYSTDTSFDRVPTLIGRSFDFGVTR